MAGHGTQHGSAGDADHAPGHPPEAGGAGWLALTLAMGAALVLAWGVAPKPAPSPVGKEAHDSHGATDAHGEGHGAAGGRGAGAGSTPDAHAAATSQITDTDIAGEIGSAVNALGREWLTASYSHGTLTLGGLAPSETERDAAVVAVKSALAVLPKIPADLVWINEIGIGVDPAPPAMPGEASAPLADTLPTPRPPAPDALPTPP